MNAFARIAARLRELNPIDRDWLLGRLAAEDCRRVSNALREHRAREQAGTSPPEETADAAATGLVQGRSAQGHAGQEMADESSQQLARANAAEVRRALAEQPDWAIALLLSRRKWPWTQEILRDLTPERLRALRALAGELAQTKPKVCDAIVRAVGVGMAPTELSRATAATHAVFDAALANAMEELPVIEHWQTVRL
jgi:hypothetical protein